MDTRPIGIFDSGIGGLTVASAIAGRMPAERLIYFGDTAHLPYGDKSPETIREYSFRIVEFLIQQDCKLIVIACNSASAAASAALKERFAAQIPLVNVIDPLVHFVERQRVRRVGIIATKATINSGVYERKLQSLIPNIRLFSMATPLLVPMIEEGFVHNRVSQAILSEYLSHPGFDDIEALLLACTHYPLIRPHIEAFFQNRVSVWDSTEATATAVFDELTLRGILSPDRGGPHLFCVSDYTTAFEQAARMFYLGDIQLKHVGV